MKSGLMKRVLAFSISLAMLTGSIPANAEDTVSGASIPTVEASSIGVETDTQAQAGTDNSGSGDTQTTTTPTDTTTTTPDSGTTIIDDGQTPTTPAPSTDGVGSGGASGSVSDNTGDDADNGTTVSGNEGTNGTVSGNVSDSVSDNSVSDNTLSGNTLSDNTLSGNEIEYITWSKTVDGVTVTVSANKASVPEGADLSVEQLDPVEIEVLEDTIAEEEAQQNIVVKKYKAFDISLVNEDEEVQPTEEVKVTFTGDILIDEKESGDVLKVYHLDDSNTQEVTDEETGETTDVGSLNDMDGSVEGDSVVMDTPHFSTYLIALTGTETGLVTNEYVSVNSNKTVEEYSVSGTDNDKRYIQVRVYCNDVLVKTAPADLNNYIQFNGDTEFRVQNLTISAGLNYSISRVAFKNSLSTYSKTNLTTVTKDNGTYSIEVYRRYYEYNYLDVYVSSNLTTENFKANLFDYDTDPTNQASNAASGTGQPFLFTPTSGSYGSYLPYNTCQYNGVTQGIVRDNLQDEKPVFNYKTADLFGPDTSWKASYFNVDFPFVYDAGTKYYEFDSTKHKATFNTATSTMSVTNFTNAGFFPFGSSNFHFGMNMSVDFYMTDDGLLGGAPIIYNFSGDDDVWVYIDGKLVLDLGGIHPNYEGSINFATGQVDVSKVSPTNIASSYNLYSSNKGITLAGLADGEQHKIQIFYLERGAGDSNCKIKFNLPQLPQKNVLKVTNTVSNNNLEEDEIDTTGFVYTVKKGADILTGVPYTLVDTFNPANNANRTTDAINGTFTLLTGQTATFSKNQNNTNIVEGTYTVTQVLQEDYESYYKNYKDSVLITDTSATPTSTEEAAQLESEFSVVLDTSSSHVYKADYFNNCIESVPPVISTTKSAHLRDWNDRTYDISLSANAVVGSHTVTQNSDIMLVLDRSGSMAYNDTVVTYNLINSTGDVTSLNPNITYYVTTSSGDASVLSYRLIYDEDDGNPWYVKYSNSFGDWDYYSDVKTSYPKIYTRTTTTVNRMTSLKSASTGFVDATNAESPDSKLGIVSFNTSATTNNSLGDVSDNVSSLKTTISNLTANDGTRPDLGLANAYYELNGALSINQRKYVILFTDGKPEYGGISEATLKSYAVTQANNLDAIGVTVYTVFLGTDATNRDWLANNIATSTAHAFSASNAGGLDAIFDQISQEISDYENATITDYIDSRFALVKPDNATPYTNEEITAVTGGIVLPDGGVLNVDGGGQQYITWTVPISELTKGNTWNKGIIVKARDSFIGDNNVTTNGNGSGVTIGGVTEAFDQPVVNVKARFSAKEASDTIFDGEKLGETLQNTGGVLTGDYLNTERQNQIFNPANVVWINGSTEVPLAAVPTGTSFTYSWFKDDGDSIFDSEDTSLSSNAIYEQTDSGKYFLKVAYVPNAATGESNGASDNNTVTESNAFAVGTYTVDKITGRITVLKKIKRADIRFSQGDPIFTFKLAGNNGKTYYKQVRFSETKTYQEVGGYITLSVVFNGLVKGQYTLSEEYTVRYQAAELNDVSLEANTSSISGKTAIYNMQLPQNIPTDKIIDGYATYRNEKTYDNNDSDTDIVVNKFSLDENNHLVIAAVKLDAE